MSSYLQTKEKVETEKEMGVETKRVNCHFCAAGFSCLLLVKVKDGRVVNVTMDSERSPSVLGTKCLRGFLDDNGSMMLEYHNHPDRLNYPLKRVGERGEGKWQRLSWDQALDEVAAKLAELKEKYGAECVMPTTGTAHFPDNGWTPWRFSAAFGTPNKLGHEQICYGPSACPEYSLWGWSAVGGSLIKKPVDLYYNPSTNSDQSNPAMWPRMVSEASRGAKRIHIDPRFCDTSRIADLWLQVRPGSDIAIHLAVINLMISNGWYDRGFVEKWTNGTLLARTDTQPNPKILRESDIKVGGSREKYVVWDTASKSPKIYDPIMIQHEFSTVKPALEGTYTVTLADGSTATCKTAWDLLVDRVKEWTPEKAAEITWVSADKIRQLAKMLGDHVGKVISASGYGHQPFTPGIMDNARSFLISALILTGAMGVPGGTTVAGPFSPDEFVSEYELELKPDETVSPEQKKKQLSGGFPLMSFPAYDMMAKYQKRRYGTVLCAKDMCQPHPPTVWRATITGQPYPIRAFIMCAKNALQIYGNAKIVYEAMMKMDLIVDLEFFMTSSAMVSDYVFPMADTFERPSFSYGIFGTMPVIIAGERAVQPQFERRTDYDFFRGLGIRLGQEKNWPWKTLEEVNDYRLSRSPWKSFKEFVDKQQHYMKPLLDAPSQDQINPKTGRPKGFATPSSKLEIYSIYLEDLGADPLPRYHEPNISPYSTPMLAKEYPLILMTCIRHLPFAHTQFYALPSARKRHPDPLVEIHPHTAEPLGIANGDWVWVETRRGRMQQKARLSFGIHPRVICVEHDWWFPEKPGPSPSLYGCWDSNSNVLTEDDPELCDPVLGSWPHVALLCKIYKD